MNGAGQGRARSRSSRRSDVGWVVAGLVAVVGGIWFAARLAGDDEPAAPTADAEPGVSHVHGLGVNPSDGSLVVATHFGSFRLPADGDDATRIGGSYQDTMGFTVVGDDHFLGSGHPDIAGIQAGQPTRLGLIESTDAGVTWTIRSLGDEVDFHALAAAGDRVYGWDASSGRFMVSTDREDWDTLATMEIFAFAVDPADTEHIVATTPNGLAESTDAGRTWTSMDGPGLATVSWSGAEGLWGAEPDGAVWRFDGTAWTSAGRLPGAPQAFLAAEGALYAAVHDADGVTAIVQSNDDGRTWDLRYRDAAA